MNLGYVNIKSARFNPGTGVRFNRLNPAQFLNAHTSFTDNLPYVICNVIRELNLYPYKKKIKASIDSHLGIKQQEQGENFSLNNISSKTGIHYPVQQKNSKKLFRRKSNNIRKGEPNNEIITFSDKGGIFKGVNFLKHESFS